MIETPNQPNDPHQPRPGLIVSDDDRNRRADDVIAVPLFTSRRPGLIRVPIRAGAAGIDHDSMLYCDEIVTLHHGFLVVDSSLTTGQPRRCGRETMVASRQHAIPLDDGGC
jgi:mRNA-degrading endonuclease toxin of MazEF toxin-antitoxin module